MSQDDVERYRQGEGSAAPLDEQVWQLAEWRDGLVVRWRSYASQHEALEAAGLAE